MRVRTKRILAVILAATALSVGAWAALAPHSFFTSFPLPGHHWVAPLQPYNEHLTRDVGDLYLALFAITTWAAVRPRPETFRLTGTAWLVFGIPHLAFHAAHLDLFSTTDAAANTIALTATLLLAAPLLLPPRSAPVS
jgi:Domain of unknown function (DUF4345)